MEIINQTCYLSEDIRRLFEEFRRRAPSIQEDVGKSLPSWFSDDLSVGELPDNLIIGYYNKSKNASPRYNNYRRVHHTSMMKTQTSAPRLGIVNPKKLPLNPLTALAEANNEYSSLPSAVVMEILCHFSGVLGALLSNPLSNANATQVSWDWIKDYPVRYTARNAEEDKKAAQEIRLKADIAKLQADKQKQESLFKDAISEIKEKIRHKQEKLDKLSN